MCFIHLDLQTEYISSIRPSRELLSISQSLLVLDPTKTLILTRKTSNRETSTENVDSVFNLKTSKIFASNTDKPSNVQLTVSPSYSQSIPNEQSETSKIFVSNTDKPSNVQLTVSPSFSQSVPNEQSKTSRIFGSNTDKPSNVQLTVSPSFSQSVPNEQSKTSRIFGSWWFLLSVVGGGLLVIIGIVVIVRCKKSR